MATYTAQNVCTFRNGSWIAGVTTYIRQGYWAEGGNYQNIGAMIFDTAAIRAAYATSYPTAATLTVTRIAAGGYNYDGTMILYAGNATGMPAAGTSSSVAGTAPSKVTDGYSYTVSGGVGTKIISISTALIDSIGIGASNCLFMQTTSTAAADYMAWSGRDDLTKVVLTITWQSRTTAATAPTSCSVSATLSENAVTLSWSGASGGTNNAVTGYEIQYRESSNNSAWGAWTALVTVSTTAASGSASVSPPSTRGYYRQFQIRTLGAAGSSYYSPWKTSTNSLRRNTLPTAPTTCAASPTTYSTQNVTLTWSGAAGGTSAVSGYRISSRTSTDGTNWSGWTVLATLSTTASTGSYTPSVTRADGTYTQFCVYTIDALGVLSGGKTSNNILCELTPATAPTTCGLSATLAEGNITLSWSGATAGTAGPIAGYNVQYADSSSGTSRGAWTALSFVSSQIGSGSLSVAPSSTRGNYRRFRVQTESAAGTAYNSGWIISSSVRRNTLPTVPAVFTATPQLYTSPPVTLGWSGTVAGTSAIARYDVWRRDKAAGGTAYGSWAVIAQIASAAASGAYTDAAAPDIPGSQSQYSLRVFDALAAGSDFAYSGTVTRNTPPAEPVIVAPKSGSYTYNDAPAILIQLAADPEGDAQTLYVTLADGETVNSADNPDYFSISGTYSGAARIVFAHTQTAVGAKNISVWSRDSLAPSTTAKRSFSVESSPFTPKVPNVTHVQALHMSNLRAAANAVRNYYNLPPKAWSGDVPLVAGRSPVRDWAKQILEVRAAIDEVVAFINTFFVGSPLQLPGIDWRPLGSGRPRADVMNQLADFLTAL